jgi:type IV pilus assembly protein PilA
VKQKKAFTLIELMIVVAIIGILAAIAVPNFVKFQCRSKQSEAKGNLKALYVAEEAFRAENDRYGSVAAISAGVVGSTVTNVIGFVPKGGKTRYRYVTDSASATAFLAVASANSASIADQNDRWTISQANNLLNPSNACD